MALTIAKKIKKDNKASLFFLFFRDDDGFYLDIFDQPRNVPMSTYLVAIVIGDLDYREDYVRDIRVRIS